MNKKEFWEKFHEAVELIPARKDREKAHWELHRKYYAQFCNISLEPFTDEELAKFKGLLDKGDIHLNDIPISWWDNRTHFVYYSVINANKALNGAMTYSPCELICAIKELARLKVEAKFSKEH